MMGALATLRHLVEAAALGAAGSVKPPGPGYIWPQWDGPETGEARSYAEVDKLFLVPPGHHTVEDQAWVRSSIVECHGEGDHPKLPGVPSKWYVHIHRRVEPHLREALRRAAISAPEYTIQRIGGYVWRT